MTDFTKDPREGLITMGQQLLDALYATHQHSEEHKTVLDAVREWQKNPLGEMPELLKNLDMHKYIRVALEGIQQAEELDRLTDSYLMLRSTIEALDAPRAEMPRVD